MAEYDLSDYDYGKKQLENELKELKILFAMAVASCGGKILIPDNIFIKTNNDVTLSRHYDAEKMATVFSIKGHE